MTAFKKTVVVTILLITCYIVSNQYKPDMTLVYPDNCSFTLDQNFSRSMQLEIKAFIDDAYKKDKNPSNLLPSIEEKFTAIKSIVIDMQNPEQLNFTIQSYQPIFRLNDSLIVCKQGHLFNISTFDHAITNKLESVSYQGPLSSNAIDRLMQFVASLSDPILKEFSIRWLGKYDVWLDQKQGDDLSLLVSYTLPPTMQDVVECRKLRGQVVDKPCKDKRGKPCTKNTTWVCDLRFDQQIVLFSTNKGG